VRGSLKGGRTVQVDNFRERSLSAWTTRPFRFQGVVQEALKENRRERDGEKGEYFMNVPHTKSGGNRMVGPCGLV